LGKFLDPLILKNIFCACQESNHHSALILLTTLSGVWGKVNGCMHVTKFRIPHALEFKQTYGREGKWWRGALSYGFMLF
jgi:hypothetical protein